MKRLALAWIAAALSFVAMDAIWLSQVAPRLDMPLIGEILTDKVDFVAAIDLLPDLHHRHHRAGG